jgi:putative ATPase
MKELGYNRGYQYAHNSPDAYLPQEYLPDQLRDALFYTPGTFGYERKIAERMEWWAQLKSGEEKRERDEKNLSGKAKHPEEPESAE